ncbi:alpha/beta fold hydrolase [Saccharothrix sp. S26]|uniref:alpha/beta fold hydrolase n=1 Tax=Saccharothrix sp. S26 TaxID=2907215 RepID=UPI001F171FEE|nr:alpha/beta fold hydrolase [Saccharothrix sp. S26]MCE7000801.1 alpha/beta fold hydrolase [Saccharothrix sp. S26]
MTASTAERTLEIEEHWIDVDGTATRYLEAGTGPPVLLIPGEGSVAEEWYDVVQGLAGRYRAVAIDLPGYGYTEPITDTSAAALAAFVWRFVRALGLRRPVLIGHSLGGAVAIRAALEQPSGVPALVLVGSADLGRAINPLAILQSVTPLGDLTVWLVPVLPGGPWLHAAVVALFGSFRPWRIHRAWWSSQARVLSTPVALETSLRAQRAAVGLFGQRDPVLGRLGELPMPTLVAWGLQDRQLPFWQGIAARRRLRRGRLVLVPHASHFLPAEAPEELVRVVRRFLAEVSDDQARGEWLS